MSAEYSAGNLVPPAPPSQTGEIGGNSSITDPNLPGPITSTTNLGSNTNSGNNSDEDNDNFDSNNDNLSSLIQTNADGKILTTEEIQERDEEVLRAQTAEEVCESFVVFPVVKAIG